MNNTAKVIILGVIVYIFFAGATYFLFNSLNSSKAVKNTTVAVAPTKLGEQEQFDSSLPKTQECPLNGELYSTQQQQWWEKHRPLAVMIENSLDARPQSGISFADVTYEALAEGGITRTMNVYYCQDAGIIGPVRSARTYFVDYASEYGHYPLYAHVGGANTPGPADALGQLIQYGWQDYNNLDQFSIGYPVFWRDYDRLGHDVATEHTMYSSTTKLWDYAAKSRGLTNVDKQGTSWDQGFVPYTFKNDADNSKRPAAQTISFDFGGASGLNDYSVEWDYDTASNSYLRKNGGQSHMDKDTNKQLSAKDVIILFEKESHANDGYEGNEHMLYGTTGSGTAFVFMDGQKINARWSKASRTARTLLTDTSGRSIQFTRGKLWFEIVGIGDQITIQ